MSVRGLAVGVLIAMLASLGLASSAMGQIYEPNDSFITGFGPLTAGTTYSAGTETDNDEDYYFFYVPRRAQVFFNLTATNTDDSAVCASVSQQTPDRYSSIDNTSLYVREGKTQTAAVTLDRGKYFFLVAECSNAGETYTFSISPPGATSTYDPFAAECANAHGPVVAASEQLRAAQATVVKARRRLAKARARGARRSTLRARRARLRRARSNLKAAKGSFKAATATEAAACSVPM